jgi:hypothetical protein
MFRSSKVCMSIVLFVLFAVPPLYSADTPTANNVADIQNALKEPTSMEFSETPLNDVVEYLKDLHKQKHPGFEIVLDTKALNDAGVTPETAITKNLKGIPLRSALHLMLRDLSLTFVIRNNVLLITTPENAFYAKVYDVADLVSQTEGEKGSSAEALVDMIAKTAKVSTSQKANGPGWIAGLRSTGIAAVVVYQTEEAQEEVAELLDQLRGAKHSK